MEILELNNITRKTKSSMDVANGTKKGTEELVNLKKTAEMTQSEQGEDRLKKIRAELQAVCGTITNIEHRKLVAQKERRGRVLLKST